MTPKNILDLDGNSMPSIDPNVAKALKVLSQALVSLEDGTLKSFALITISSTGELHINYHGPNLAELHLAADKLSDLFVDEIFK